MRRRGRERGNSPPGVKPYLEGGRRHRGVLGGAREQEVLRQRGVVGAREPEPEHAAPDGVLRAGRLLEQDVHGHHEGARRAPRAPQPHGVHALRARPERVHGEHVRVHEQLAVARRVGHHVHDEEVVLEVWGHQQRRQEVDGVVVQHLPPPGEVWAKQEGSSRRFPGTCQALINTCRQAYLCWPKTGLAIRR